MQPKSESWYGKPASLDESDLRKARALYYGLITEVDHHVGRIVQALEARAEVERTLVLFTADHGEMLGDHWLLGKEGFFPEAFHVPLIVVDPSPGTVRGLAVEAFTEQVDLMPTILERLGLEIPLQCDGASLVPWLEGRTPGNWRQAAHYEHDFRDVATMAFEAALGLPSDRCALAVRQSGATRTHPTSTACRRCATTSAGIPISEHCEGPLASRRGPGAGAGHAHVADGHGRAPPHRHQADASGPGRSLLNSRDKHRATGSGIRLRRFIRRSWSAQAPRGANCAPASSRPRKRTGNPAPRRRCRHRLRPA